MYIPVNCNECINIKENGCSLEASCGPGNNFMYHGFRKPLSKIPGVGPDAETVTNKQGGKQSKVLYAFDALDPKAMFAMCKVLHEGRLKYGDDENWRKIPAREHINHAIIHFMAYLAGDRTDEHLSHAMCRAMMATAVDMDVTKDKAHS